MEIQAYGISDVGCVRDTNEDSFLVRDDLSLYIVADGVGGAAAGEVASRLFVDNCEEEFALYSGWNEDYKLLIARCFDTANRRVIDHTREHPETKGMGCTAEVITFKKGMYYLGHVGDSRTYLIRNGHLERLTRDHSFVQEQIDLGLLKPEEAKSHWLRNAIYRAVGHQEDLEVDLISGKVKPGDQFLLCSDGLTDMVAEDKILNIIDTDAPLETRVAALIEAAKNNGGRDNITALVCEIKRNSRGGLFSAFISNRE